MIPARSTDRVVRSLAIVATSAVAAAAAGRDQAITWHTIDCGGGRSADGALVLTGTIGQFDTGDAVGTSSEIALHGGFWLPCPADLSHDSAVDVDDVLAIVEAWDNVDGREDLDGSGRVDFGDIVVVLSSWGECY